MSEAMKAAFWDTVGSALRGVGNDYMAFHMQDASISPPRSQQLDPGEQTTKEIEPNPGKPVELQPHDDSIPEPAMGHSVA